VIKAKPQLELYVLFPIACRIANQRTRSRWKTLKDSHRIGGQAELAENLCASFFNEDLSNDTTFI
jgi:hypothetical protein